MLVAKCIKMVVGFLLCLGAYLTARRVVDPPPQKDVLKSDETSEELLRPRQTPTGARLFRILYRERSVDWSCQRRFLGPMYRVRPSCRWKVFLGPPEWCSD